MENCKRGLKKKVEPSTKLFLHGGPGDGSYRFEEFQTNQLWKMLIWTNAMRMPHSGHSGMNSDADLFAQTVSDFIDAVK